MRFVRARVVTCLAVLCAAVLGAVGCDGPQSALAPAGPDAARIATLFRWMVAGAAVVWVAMVALAIYAVRASPEKHSARSAARWVIGGGVVFPAVVLTALLACGLWMLPAVLALPPPGGLEITVSGEQWWWRVRYRTPEGLEAELANELRLPVGERVRVRLESPDVIHSFWVPALAGKVDMIPGRVTWIALEPSRTGVFRGACAEYCGASHAWMAFEVIVLERPAFDDWLRVQAGPAAAPASAEAERGAQVFLAHGCGACHTVRGTPADGVVGPDLTHVGGRTTLAAARLPNDRAAFRDWLARPGDLKPGVHMPAFGMLAPADLGALAAYLEGLG